MLIFQFNKDFQGPTESHDFWELVYTDKGSIICGADDKEIRLSEGEVLRAAGELLEAISTPFFCTQLNPAMMAQKITRVIRGKRFDIFYFPE